MDEPATSASTTTWSRTLLQVAGGLLVAYGIYYMNQDAFARALAARAGAAPDNVTTLESRLRPVLADTAPDSVLGLICDPSLKGTDLGARLLMGQYILVPRRLGLYQKGDPLVVGVFDGPVEPTLQQEHLQIVKDYGRGVLLLKGAP